LAKAYWRPLRRSSVRIRCRALATLHRLQAAVEGREGRCAGRNRDRPEGGRRQVEAR
jgi:hypothetical protein